MAVLLFAFVCCCFFSFLRSIVSCYLFGALTPPFLAWKACFLRACRAWRAPGPWLGCGVACLRLEQWKEAEDALQHASRLDCNSPLVWGHLALLLLSMGEDRCEVHVIPVQKELL